eukprot:Rmarinus@m.26187
MSTTFSRLVSFVFHRMSNYSSIPAANCSRSGEDLSKRFVVIGLGNPGKKFHGTRHNAGLAAVDRIVELLGASFKDSTSSYHLYHHQDGTSDVFLLKPRTFMNLSGNALRSFSRKYGGLQAAEVLVMCDDMALPVGTVRLRPKGSAGGHHGLESVEAALKTKAYKRLRIGVGSPPSSCAVTAYVLGKISNEEVPKLALATDAAAKAVEMWVTDGKLDKAMTFVNRSHAPPVSLKKTLDSPKAARDEDKSIGVKKTESAKDVTTNAEVFQVHDV